MSGITDNSAELALKEKELELSGDDTKPNTMFDSRLAELEEPERHVYNHTTKMCVHPLRLC